MSKFGTAFLLLSALASSGIAEPPSDLVRLRLHSTRKFPFASGQKRQFKVAVASGQFFHLAVQKKGIDLVLAVVDPQGHEVVSFNSPNGNYGFEDAALATDQAGLYTIELTAKGDLRVLGQISIALLALRAPTGEDRLELKAQTLFRAGVDADRAGDAASLRRAVDSYKEAAALFDRLHERYLEALALHRLGFVYEALKDPAKALDYYNQALAIRRATHDRAGEGATLNNMGVIYLARRDKSKALNFLSQALKYRRAVHDRAGEASSLFNMAKAAANGQALDYYQQALEIFRAINDRSREALCLELISDAIWELGDKRKAAENYDRARAVYQALGNHAREGSMLINMGLGYSEVGENAKTVGAYNQALTIYRALGDGTNEAIALTNMGEAYAALSEPRRALEAYEQALQIRRALGDRKGEAVSLDSVGTAYLALGEKQKAAETLNEALAMARTDGPRAMEGNILHDLGAVYNDLGEYRKALELLNRALVIRRAEGDRIGEFKTLSNMGVAYSHLGQKQKALELYGQTLRAKRAAGDRAGEAIVLNNMASIYADLGDRGKAVELLNESLEIVRAAGNRTAEATTLANLGRNYAGIGQNQKGLDLSFQALQIYRAVGVKADEALTLQGIGEIYSAQAEYQQALGFTNQALQIVRSDGNKSAEAGALNDIGQIYSALGNKQKALEIYQQCLAIYQAAGDRWYEAHTLGNIGNCYAALRENQRALETYDQALTIMRALDDRSSEGALLDHTASIKYELGDKQSALDLYRQALKLRHAVGDRDGEASTLVNLGQAYDDLGQKQNALAMYLLALPILRSTGNRQGEANTLNSLQVLFAAAQPDLAILFGKQAVNLLQTVRRSNRGLEDSLRQSYERSIAGNYRNLASLLVERERFGEAEEVLSLLKDKEASDFIRRDSVSDTLRPATLSDPEKAALSRYEQLVGQIVALGHKQAALLAKRDSDGLNDAEIAESRKLESDLEPANAVLRRFFDEQEKSLGTKSDAGARIREFREAEGIQSRLAELGPDVVAIYTLVTKDKYVAMLVTSGARKAYTTVIKEADLNAKIFEFRKRLQNPASDPLPLAQDLYRIVFPEGLRQDLDSIKTKTIMWSVDGALRYIPIAALHDGHGYLVQWFRNSLITPASMVNLKEKPQTRWQGVGYGVSKAKAGFSPLDSVPAELNGIFRRPGEAQQADTAPLAGTVRLDDAFTQEAFQHDLNALNHRVVHIATHFDARPNADESLLLLGDGTPWTMKQIGATTRLFSGVDLLTLSACSTAFSNRSEDGREVDSFATIAQQLGAMSVIASLWSVNDEATAKLMQTMYRLRQQNPPIDKTEALRQAQEQMLSGVLRSGANGPVDRGTIAADPAKPADSHDWRHPFFWAPFILIGNWK